MKRIIVNDFQLQSHQLSQNANFSEITHWIILLYPKPWATVQEGGPAALFFYIQFDDFLGV